jgi:hypothetical protein
MQTTEIIAEIDSEIARLQQVKALLSSTTGAAKAAPKKRQLSPEARARIAAAQKTRWAKARKAAK